MARLSRINVRFATPAELPPSNGVDVVLAGQAITASQGDVTFPNATAVLSGQVITAAQEPLAVTTGVVVPFTGQAISVGQEPLTVDTGGTGWSITNIDLDNNVFDGQEGVIIAIAGTVAASGKKVWIKQGPDWVEQTVTAEDASSATITVDYGGVLNEGTATLYVRNPL
jgi:hypothetical protein